MNILLSVIWIITLFQIIFSGSVIIAIIAIIPRLLFSLRKFAILVPYKISLGFEILAIFVTFVVPVMFNRPLNWDKIWVTVFSTVIVSLIYLWDSQYIYYEEEIKEDDK